MKKILTLILSAGFALAANAQTSAITACKKSDGAISIVFDYSKNCSTLDAAKKDTLGKRTAIGFHSGANTWGSVVAWDAATAIKANRVAGTSGNTSKFHVVIAAPKTYYNLAADPTNIMFVFNDGPTKPTDPWTAEAKEGSATGCQDFAVTFASLAACTAAAQDLRSDVTVTTAPNPFKEFTYLTFSNPEGKVYSLNITNVTGQVVRSYSNITSSAVEIKRESLASGVYFAVLRNADGRFLTEKLIVE